jgi:hypothetical protein
MSTGPTELLPVTEGVTVCRLRSAIPPCVVVVVDCGVVAFSVTAAADDDEDDKLDLADELWLCADFDSL